MTDSAAAPRDKYDQWVFDTFGVDPSTYPPLAKSGGNAPAPAAAVGGEAANDPRNVASMDKTTLVAGQGKNPVVANAGGGVELAAYHPASGTVGGRAGGSSLDPVNKGLDTADKALGVLDKFEKLAFQTVKATANSTKIKNDSKTVSVIPAGAKSMDLQGGADGHTQFHLSIKNIFGGSLGELTIFLIWQGGFSYRGHGRFLANIRVDVTGDVFPFQDVDIITTYGDPTNAGTEGNPVASLPIDIMCLLKSLTITRGQKLFSGTLSGASGYKAIIQA